MLASTCFARFRILLLSSLRATQPGLIDPPMGQGVRSRSRKAMFRERPLIPSTSRLQDDSVKTFQTHSEFRVVGAHKLRAANCRLRGQRRADHEGTTASMEQGPKRRLAACRCELAAQASEVQR
jgi:hypothetical protein